MPDALVTGVGGQDGRYMARLLLSKGYRVTGTVRPGSRPPDLADVRFLEVEMRDDSSVERAVRDVQPDEIYNFAGVSSLQEAGADPEGCRDVNFGGLERLVRAAPSHTRICQASSALIFGPPDGHARNEDTPLGGVGPYAEAKAAAHRLIAEERGAGRYAVSAILFNHESPLRSRRFVSRKVTHAVAEIKKGVRTHLEVGNIGATRDWGFAGDYVRAMWSMLQQERPEDLVIATGIDHTVGDLVRAAFEEADIDDWQEYLVYASDEPEPSSHADPSRARETLAWKPEVDFRGLIGMMVRHDLETA